MNQGTIQGILLQYLFVIFKLDLLSPIRRGICQMQARAYANGKLVSEAEIMAQITKVKGND